VHPLEVPEDLDVRARVREPDKQPGQRGLERVGALFREPGAVVVRLQSARARRGVDAERILQVVMPGHRQQKATGAAARLAHDELRAFRAEGELLRRVVRLTMRGVGGDVGARRLLRDPHRVRIRRRDREKTVLGKRRGELLVRRLVVRHVAVDVGMIELDAVEDPRARAEVQELVALDEERRDVHDTLD
jgi:hypothetical protein